jgi:holo-[acyl-carrier protein] synthase
LLELDDIKRSKMVKGIGTDLVELARVEDSLQRFGDRFARRVLTPEELTEFEQKNRSVAFLAKRWAAKEAAAKALGTGIGASVGFHDLRIDHDELGAPRLILSGKAVETAASKGVDQTHISLSDEQHYALAFVVVS